MCVCVRGDCDSVVLLLRSVIAVNIHIITVIVSYLPAYSVSINYLICDVNAGLGEIIRNSPSVCVFLSY